MFSQVAPKYDFINHLLSFNIDRHWRKLLVDRMASTLEDPASLVLDLCCGTGDVLLELNHRSNGRIVGVDFCHPMLVAAKQKLQRAGFNSALFEADALSLPVAADSFSAISISFGFRNLANYSGGLAELHRVLKPGGTLAILEFSHPRGFMKAAYGLYSRIFLPLTGALISGSMEAYRYLPDSIRKFPTADELIAMMREAGFSRCRFELLSGGIAAIHVGVKSAARL
jgi:demethylmenaquinone methyltransferase/2-methoxy-6-polyprenyl-1,4-benzoquinol methylase